MWRTPVPLWLCFRAPPARVELVIISGPRKGDFFFSQLPPNLTTQQFRRTLMFIFDLCLVYFPKCKDCVEINPARLKILVLITERSANGAVLLTNYGSDRRGKHSFACGGTLRSTTGSLAFGTAACAAAASNHECDRSSVCSVARGPAPLRVGTRGILPSLGSACVPPSSPRPASHPAHPLP